MSAKGSNKPNFAQVYNQFLSEMGLTFPELDASSEKAKKLGFRQFTKSVAPILRQIASRDSSIFDEKGVEIAPGVVMNKALWKDAGKSTHVAIWDFLSSLILLATYEEKHSKDNTVEDHDFSKMFDLSGADIDLQKMFKGLGEQFSNQSFSGFFEGIKEAAETFKEKFGDSTGISGEGFTMPKIPEKLFKGHIAKIATDLAKEFKPEDFGLSNDMLETNDTGATFEYLQELFTKNPELLMKGAKKIAQRIQDKLKNGEVKREELIQEAEELMGEFQNNPMFKGIFEQLGAQLRGMGGNAETSNNTESERRRAVQERLRKKIAAKKGQK